jgi:hypothetical protein
MLIDVLSNFARAVDVKGPDPEIVDTFRWRGVHSHNVT